MWLLYLKKYAYTILAVLVGSLAFLVRIFYSRSQKFKKQADVYKEQAEYTKKVLEKDIETEMEHESRSAKIVKDIEDEGHTDELSDPNQW